MICFKMIFGVKYEKLPLMSNGRTEFEVGL